MNYHYYNYLNNITKSVINYHTQEQKEEWAIVGALDMIANLLFVYGHKPFFLRKYHHKKIEKQAIYMTQLLGDQAFELGNYHLFIHWTNVRIMIRGGQYKRKENIPMEKIFYHRDILKLLSIKESVS